MSYQQSFECNTRPNIKVLMQLEPELIGTVLDILRMVGKSHMFCSFQVPLMEKESFLLKLKQAKFNLLSKSVLF